MRAAGGGPEGFFFLHKLLMELKRFFYHLRRFL